MSFLPPYSTLFSTVNSSDWYSYHSKLECIKKGAQETQERQEINASHILVCGITCHSLLTLLSKVGKRVSAVHRFSPFEAIMTIEGENWRNEAPAPPDSARDIIVREDY